MIYKEYSSTQENTYSNYVYQDLYKMLEQGWEIVTSFAHGTNMSNVTFILGRNEAPKALYGKE